MTLDDAFAELGIDRDTGAGAARRAYLKLLKLRKPETDPQGFMRLREAYELAKAEIESRDAFLQGFGVVAPFVPRRDPPARTAPPKEEPPAQSEEEPPLEEPAAPADEPIGEPVAAAPEPPTENDGPNEASVDALLAAGLPLQAAEALTCVFDAATKRGAGPAPPVDKALRLLAMLHAENAVAAAEPLYASLSRWLRASGQEARVIRGDAAARWTVLHELASLPPSFPGVVRSAIGRAVLAGDLGGAYNDLVSVRNHHVLTARSAAASLRGGAPVLGAAFADVLDPRMAPARAAAPQRSSKGGWAVGVLAVGLLRVLMMISSGTSSTSSHYSPTRYNPSLLNPPAALFDASLYLSALDGGLAVPGPEGRLADLKERVRQRAERVRDHARYTLEREAGRGRVDYTKLPADADRVVAALERDDCKGARAALQKLEGRMLFDAGGADDEIGRVEVETLGRTLRAFCVELAKVRAPAATGASGGVVLDAGPCGGTSHP